MTATHTGKQLRLAALAFATTVLTTATAQAVPPPRPPSDRLGGHVGYFGEFAFHPGVFGGVEVRPVGNRRGELLLTGNLASYVHVRNHVGLMLWPELGGRLRLGRRVELEALGGVGYLHTFLAAPVYVVDDAGRVHRARNTGRAAVMPTGAIGIGIATKHVTPFLRVQAFGQYPYNHHMLLHVAVLLGVRL